VIFLLHFANSLLVGRLGYELLSSRIAERAAAIVFLINPITLTTLTWISCFSYVLGTSFVLISLLAFSKSQTKDTPHPLLWQGVALACYIAALLSSHETFFAPALFPLLGWARERAALRRGLILSVPATAVAFSVHFLVYNFDRYGIEATGLLTPGFFSAFVSSAWSFGLSLGLAYPLSFFVKTLNVLRIFFAEPVRWAMTLALVGACILSYKPTRAWRLCIVLAASFAALIAPYVIRLYLMPSVASYHISYVLSGRVFYLPFIVLAWAWGGILARLLENTQGYPRWAWLFLLLPVVAYLYAFLFLYDRTDFAGLQVLREPSQVFLHPWTPYVDHHPAWSIGMFLVVLVAWIARSRTKAKILQNS
jgi:hypothetical protein